MSREDGVWLLIKAFGLYFLAMAFLTAPDVASTAAKAFGSWGGDPSAQPGEMAEIIRQASYKPDVLTRGVKFLFYIVAGIYLVRDGRHVQGWLIPASSSQ